MDNTTDLILPHCVQPNFLATMETMKEDAIISNPQHNAKKPCLSFPTKSDEVLAIMANADIVTVKPTRSKNVTKNAIGSI